VDENLSVVGFTENYNETGENEESGKMAHQIMNNVTGKQLQ
jgi:hypothetical protein